MLSILLESFVVIICSIPLLSYMNLIKDSLFRSSKNKKYKRLNQHRSGNYEFRQANNSLIDPFLYTFENNDIELNTIDTDQETKSNDNEHSIRARSSRENFKPSAQSGGSVVIVEKPVLPNETIQAFAIRHRVPVSQLRRLNNLQNDQEFYALAHCRVPVRRFGLLHECSEPSSTIVDLNEQTRVSLPVTHLSQENHFAFLNAMDQDLALMRSKVEKLIEESSTTDLVTSSLANSVVEPVENPKNTINCDGTDCGCRLWHIIIVMILIALIPIIFAYFYIKYHQSN